MKSYDHYSCCSFRTSSADHIVVITVCILTFCIVTLYLFLRLSIHLPPAPSVFPSISSPPSLSLILFLSPNIPQSFSCTLSLFPSLSVSMYLFPSFFLRYPLSLTYTLSFTMQYSTLTLIRALSIVEKVRDALRERLSEVPWMSDGTRTEAMKKMESFKVKIGFPDKWIDYSTLTVLKGENLLNFFASNRFSFVLDLNR